ncbi:MAG: tetratricopeptide repeat protein [Catenulispora sp.]|nr:tetratricopeptide repeat protein [Catenulispora sp.]
MRYALLGSLKVWDDTGAEISVPAGKQCSVLAALLLRPGQVVGFDALVAVLWGDRPPASARSGLATYVSRLRTALGAGAGVGAAGAASRVRYEGRGYLFAPEPSDEIDYVRAAELEGRARAAAEEGRWAAVGEAAAQALALWHGEALADLESDVLRAEFLPYLEELRIRLETLQIDAHLAQGEFDAILPTLRALSGSHPLNEPFHERNFLALYGAGRHADAQEWYRRVRTRLREELGTEPSPLLRRFYNQTLRGVDAGDLIAELLAPRRPFRVVDSSSEGGAPATFGAAAASGTPAASGASAGSSGPAGSANPANPPVPAGTPASGASEAAPPPPVPSLSDSGQFSMLPPLGHQLPPAPRRFVGRTAELTAITEAMAGNHPPDLAGLTLLVGMAGIGKTALALTWAHQAAATFPDGRLYVDLKGFAERGAPMAADEAVRVLLDCLGVPDHLLPATADGRLALYRAVISEKRALIVLDNVRHADQVRPLLPPSGPAQLLATSRNALASLVTIDFARTVSLQPLSASESRDLLNLRLGPERTSGREQAVAAIAEHCAHLPLALVVAAGRACVQPDIPLEDLAEQLGAVGGGLGALDGGDAAVSVRTVLSWSYRQLTPCAARLYRLLALHPGPDIPVTAAASLLGVSPVETHAALVELVAMNMSSVDGRGRYRRHSLLEAFAAERLAAEEDEEARAEAFRRLVDHYLHTVVQVNMLHATTGLPTPEDLAPAPPGTLVSVIEDSAGGIAWFDAEEEVLAALLLDLAAAGLDVEVWQLACARSIGMARNARWEEDIAAARLALSATRRLGDRVAEAHVHRIFGRDLPRIGDPEGGMHHLDRALELYDEAGHAAGAAETKRTMANVRFLQGDVAATLPLLRDFLDHVEATGELHAQAQGLNSLGWSYAHLGRLAEALACCRRALHLKLATGRHEHIGVLWDSLGYIHHRLGDLEESVSCYRRAIEACVAEGDDNQKALAAMRLGDVLNDLGDSTAAGASWHEALDAFEDLRRPEADLVRQRLGSIPRQRAGSA